MPVSWAQGWAMLRSLSQHTRPERPCPQGPQRCTPFYSSPPSLTLTLEACILQLELCAWLAPRTPPFLPRPSSAAPRQASAPASLVVQGASSQPLSHGFDVCVHTQSLS